MKKSLLLLVLSILSNTMFSQTTCFPQDKAGSIGNSKDSIVSYSPTSDSVTAQQNTSITPNHSTFSRTIYWVHGLGGDNTTWNKAAQAVQIGAYKPDGITPDASFPKRDANCYSQITYDESTDFNVAGNSLFGILYNLPTTSYSSTRTNDFIIAHSQGGLVSRDLDRKFTNGTYSVSNRSFGGIVTFATPHKGAAIIDNLQNQSKVQDFISTSCRALTEGKILEKSDSWLLKIFGLDKTIYQFRNGACNTIGSAVAMFAKIKTNGLADFYKPSSAYLTNLNTFKTSTPSVAFYGVKNPNAICFTTFYSFTIEEANHVKGNFRAEITDQDAMQQAKDLINSYVASRDYWEYRRSQNYNLCVPVIGMLYCGRARDCMMTRDGYQMGIDWLNSADKRWLQLLGGYIVNGYYEQYMNEYCRCPVIDFDPLNGGQRTSSKNSSSADDVYDLRSIYHVPPQELPGPNPDPAWCVAPCKWVREWAVRWRQDDIIKPSDGIVLTESASEFPGTPYKVAMDDHTLTNVTRGSNHNQIKNDANTKEALLRLLGKPGVSGTIQPSFYGNYFTTPKL